MPERNKKHYSKSTDRKSRSETRSKSSSSSSSESTHSSCSSYEKKSFDKKYKWYKNHLLKDKTMMIAGCDVYTSVFNTITQMIPVAAPVEFTTQQITLNVDHQDQVLYVRKSGVYVIEFATQLNQPAQFMFFVNAVPVFNSASGQNSGAGELIARAMIVLNKDDALTVRNYASTTGTVTINASSGGTQLGTSAEMVIRKIAPHPNDYMKYDITKECKLTERRKKFYNKLLDKLKEDPDLMIGGSDVHGSFYRQTSAVVPIETSIPFEYSQDVKGLILQPNLTDITIPKDGVYQVLYLLESLKSTQITLFINGVPEPTTTCGINKGANQLYLRQILQFHKGDVVSLRNHSSNVGDITVSNDGGGLLVGSNSTLIITRLGSITPPPLIEEEIDMPEKIQQFKQFLNHHKHLMPSGSDAFFSVHISCPMLLNTGDSFKFSTNGPMRNVLHQQGKPEIIVQKSGIYKMMIDLNSDAPSQITIYVNGIPETSTTEGTDSGAGQTSLRQLVALNKGDVITLVNWQSVTPLQTSLNAGGLNVGTSVNFVGIKIADLPDNFDCKPHKCK